MSQSPRRSVAAVLPAADGTPWPTAQSVNTRANSPESPERAAAAAGPQVTIPPSRLLWGRSPSAPTVPRALLSISDLRECPRETATTFSGYSRSSKASTTAARASAPRKKAVAPPESGIRPSVAPLSSARREIPALALAGAPEIRRRKRSARTRDRIPGLSPHAPSRAAPRRPPALRSAPFLRPLAGKNRNTR